VFHDGLLGTAKLVVAEYFTKNLQMRQGGFEVKVGDSGLMMRCPAEQAARERFKRAAVWLRTGAC
jgi:hypothetical protein